MLKKLFLFVLIVGLALPVHAQSTFPAPPPGFFDALGDLGVRVGKSFTISCSNPDDGTTCRASDPLIQDWEWSFEVYPDTGIGCPQAFASIEPTATRAFRYMIQYNGTQYEYRQNADRTGLFLCTATGREEAFQGVTNPAVQCPTLPRLTIGQMGRVTDENGVPNNVREGAGRSNNKIGEIPAGQTFTVLSGPTCTADLVWWQVNYNGLVGWTAEDDAEDYYVEPVIETGAQPTQALTTANAPQIRQLSTQTLTLTPLDMDYSALLGLLAFPNGSAVALYRPFNNSAAPLTINGEAGYTLSLVEFNPASTILAAVEYNSTQDASRIRLWNIIPGNPAQMTLRQVLPMPGRLAGDMQFSPDGKRLAVSNSDGTDNFVQVYDVATGSVLATLAQTGYPDALSFNADGTRLAVATSNAEISLWDMNLFTKLQTVAGINPNNVSGGQHHVAYHPTAAVFAYGGNADQIQLWDANTLSARTLALPDRGYTPYGLAFSASGNVLLVTAGIEMLSQGKLYALDTTSGAVLFSTPIYSPLMEVANNTVYLIDSAVLPGVLSSWGVPQ